MKSFFQGRWGRIVSCLLLADMSCFAAAKDEITTIDLSIPAHPAQVDARLYGQMLEHLNDKAVYDGIVNMDGSERPHVDALLKPLKIPVVRWPGGTIVHLYHWKNGIGSRDSRTAAESTCIGGKESHKFGTDDFMQWCQKVGAEPYINLNMANHPVSGGTLQEALEWMEYVNGDTTTEYGEIRAKNGHAEPYNVKYWGLGNENYESWGRHNRESAEAYAARLYEWSVAIRDRYPDLKLLAVGYHLGWDSVILEKCNSLIDYITQHYYVVTKIAGGEIANSQNALFASLRIEAHLGKVGEMIERISPASSRANRPLKISVDEWNNRHYVDGKLLRQDPRRQFDVAVTATTLNAFIRQSQYVEMANYIFPVNAHGLIRTIGDNRAYETSIYGVFYQYRKWMVGDRIEVSVKGPGLKPSDFKAAVQGDAGSEKVSIKASEGAPTFIDASAVRGSDGAIAISLVNRSYEHPQKVHITVPQGYVVRKKWILESESPNAMNTPESQDTVKPREETISSNLTSIDIDILPTGLQLIRFEKAR